MGDFFASSAELFEGLADLLGGFAYLGAGLTLILGGIGWLFRWLLGTIRRAIF